MDTAMSEGSAAKRGATEVGQGRAVKVPRVIPHGFNDCYTVRLTYADNYRHDIGQNGSSAAQIFRADSIFDPDTTGTGHQPLMRDLWASQYDYYTVLACHYQIKLYNATADPVTYTAVGTSAQRIGPVNVVMLKTTNVNDFNSANNGLISPGAEMKDAAAFFLPPEADLTIDGTLTPADFVIDAKDADSDPTWTAVGSNPTVTRHLGYIISSAQWTGLVGVSETPYSAIIAQVILNYDVQFTQLNQSLRTTPS